MGENIKTLIDEETVTKKIKELGARISKDYAGKELELICVLKGGVYFLVELSKYITIPVVVDFMVASSYGDKTYSSGKVRISKDLAEDIKGKDVLIVEDIIDSGNTLNYLTRELVTREPASLKVATLLDKPQRREFDIKVDYEGFKIPDLFVVGCGLDYAQKYRNLPFIGYIEAQ